MQAAYGALAGPRPDPVVVARDVTRKFGDFEAVRGVSFEVARGEVFGLVGKNGAGKTTTIKMCLGLVKPTSGSITVFGAPAGSFETRRRVGYSPETPHFHPFLTVRETLGFYARLSGLKGKNLRQEVDRVVSETGLEDVMRHRAGVLSKGFTQRLAVAQALLGDPEVLFLDEPAAGLDAQGRIEMKALISKLKAHGKTVFFNSHILSDVEQLADRVAIMSRGRIETVVGLSEIAKGAVDARVTGLSSEGIKALEGLGLSVGYDGTILRLSGVVPDREPEIVELLVRLGARVYSFQPRRDTLEEIFLKTIADADASDPACGEGPALQAGTRGGHSGASRDGQGKDSQGGGTCDAADSR